tara:strand:+ start:146 stop:307 length:162 start_codon:yes stop_codon:yes gene_type:complete
MRKSQGVSFTEWLSVVVKTGKYNFKTLSKMYEEDIHAEEVKNKVGGGGDRQEE